jgi:hypothetical protein
MTRNTIPTVLALACAVPVVAYSLLHLFQTGEGEIALVAGLTAIGAFLLRKPWWSAAAVLSGLWATLNAVRILLDGAKTDGWAVGIGYLVVGVILGVSAAILARPLGRPNNYPPQ